MALDQERAQNENRVDRSIVLRHALRNALLPAISMGGLQLGLLLSGVVVVEVVFAWPGLGLYITRQLVEAHGGTLDIVSRRGEGTFATIWLP